MSIKRGAGDRSGDTRPLLTAVPSDQTSRALTPRGNGTDSLRWRSSTRSRDDDHGQVIGNGLVGVVEHLLETLETDWARGAAGKPLRFLLDYVREALAAAVVINHAFDRSSPHLDESRIPEVAHSHTAHADPRRVQLAEPAEVFRKEGEYWTLGYNGGTVRIKHTLGLVYIAAMLRHPGHEFHVVDLIDTTDDPPPAPRIKEELGVSQQRAGLGDAGEMLDTQAAVAYRRRLADLQAELDEVLALNDLGRAERARHEIAFLTQELSRALGLGGRTRRAGSHVERTRVNVSRAIATALTRIAKQHASLAQHLRRTIRTGAYCAYVPDPRAPVDWQL